MPDDQGTAPQADTTQPVAADQSTPTIDPAVQDALDAAVGDVKGEIVENPTVQPPASGEPEEEAPHEVPRNETAPADQPTDTPADGGEGRAEPAADAAPVAAPAAPETPAEPDEAGVYEPVTASDPGEFKPGDYSFDVTLADGKSVHIANPEDAAALAARIDEDPTLMAASQFMALATKAAVMEQGIASDKRAYDTQKAEYDRQMAVAQTRDETINKWDRELNYLTSRGDIPAVKPELNTAEAGAKWGTDYKDEPGVKERLDLFKFMQDENARRTAAGLDPMTSMVDAYNLMQLETSRNAAVEEERSEKATRRAKGAMVDGSSPHIPTNVGKHEIVGTGGSLNDVLSEYL